MVSSSTGRPVFISLCFYIWIGNEGTTSLSLSLHFFFFKSRWLGMCKTFWDQKMKRSGTRHRWTGTRLWLWACHEGFSLLHFKISGTFLWWLFLSCLSWSLVWTVQYSQSQVDQAPGWLKPGQWKGPYSCKIRALLPTSTCIYVKVIFPFRLS